MGALTKKRFRQSTLDFSARKSARFSSESYSKSAQHSLSAAAVRQQEEKGKAEKTQQLKKKKVKRRVTAAEMAAEKERKQLQRERADEKERERQEKARLQRETLDAQLTDIRAAFAAETIDAAVLRLLQSAQEEHSSVGLQADDGRRSGDDSKEEKAEAAGREPRQVARAPAEADGGAVLREPRAGAVEEEEHSDDSIRTSPSPTPSLPPLLSPFNSSSSSQSSDDGASTSSRVSSASEISMDWADDLPLSVRFSVTRRIKGTGLPPVLPFVRSAALLPPASVSSCCASPVDFDLSLDFPSLPLYALYYKLAGAALPEASVFSLPDWLSADLSPDTVPAYKELSRNKGRGGRSGKAKKERKGRGEEDEEGQFLCGCVAKTKDEEETEQRTREDREDRFRTGQQTAEDERWRAEEARRGREPSGDDGYLSMRRSSSVVNNCGDGCLNAALLIECDEGNCSVGAELCRNRHFTRKETALLEPFRTELKGWGLRAVDDVPADTFLIEYVGEIIDNAECQRRIAKEDARVKEAKDRLRRAGKGKGKGGRGSAGGASLSSNYYFMAVAEDVVIDAGRAGSCARFINHSCSANCIIGKWTVGAELRIAIFTQRAVSRGEELTIDYKYDRIGLEYQPCYCGADNCAGWIGGKKKQLSAEETAAVAAEGRRKGKKKLSRSRLKQLAYARADDLCAVCGDGGDVISCDARINSTFCPRVYHMQCVQLRAVPREWICPWHFCDARVAEEQQEGETEGQEEEEEEADGSCGKRAEQFCVCCCRSLCRTHRLEAETGSEGRRWRSVLYKDSQLCKTGALDMQRRDWLTAEEGEDWRWVLCDACQQQPLVLSQAEEQAMQQATGRRAGDEAAMATTDAEMWHRRASSAVLSTA